MREARFALALRALTQRGRAFVAGGLTAAACGIVFGEHDLVRIGVLAVLLPLVAAAWVSRSGNRLELVRSTTSSRVAAGQPAKVTLELTNVGPTTGTLLVEEELPRELGERPRFVVDAMAPGWHRQVEYVVRPTLRGRYEIGPLRLRVGDPFGLVEMRRRFTGTSPLVVTPPVESLPDLRLEGAWSGSGEERPRSFAVGGSADVLVRDYRMGDDLRRVHWRSTARLGELMVRQEEQPWESRCTLVVDNRASAHRGRGEDSSLEAAVAAAASIGTHLAGQGFRVRLVSAAGHEVGLVAAGDVRMSSSASSSPGSPGSSAWAAAEPGPLLDRLAVLPTHHGRLLATGWVDDAVSSGLLVAVLGRVEEGDQHFLARLRRQGTAPVALVLDVAQWEGAAQSAAEGAVPGAQDHDGPDTPDNPDAAAWLRARGWRAGVLGRRTPLAAAWREVVR